MDKDRLLELADALEKTEGRREGPPPSPRAPDRRFFDMGVSLGGLDEDGRAVPWRSRTCGTVACVAGLAALTFAPERTAQAAERMSLLDLASELLGLDARQKNALFLGKGGPGYDRTTPRTAARACRRLAAGEDPGGIWRPVPRSRQAAETEGRQRGTR